MPVPAKVLPQPPTHPLTDLETSLELSLPESLLPFLAEHNIHTLEDIRRQAGIHRLENLPLSPDDPAVKTLEAHANLSILSPDVKINQTLIQQGFDSVSAIARGCCYAFGRL